MSLPAANANLLNPQTARLFRITHVDNIPWLLENGLHCRSSGVVDPQFVSIGMQELIKKRANHDVPIPPYGTLDDYVPFYFTPWSVMLLNIKTGRNGVAARLNDEIAIIGTRFATLAQHCEHVLFTNGHAYMAQTRYYDDPAHLDQVDWRILQNRDFRKDDQDIDKSRRYQAEALVYRFVPPTAIAAIVCHNKGRADEVQSVIDRLSLSIRTAVQPDWYF